MKESRLKLCVCIRMISPQGVTMSSLPRQHLFEWVFSDQWCELIPSSNAPYLFIFNNFIRFERVVMFHCAREEPTVSYYTGVELRAASLAEVLLAAELPFGSVSCAFFFFRVSSHLPSHRIISPIDFIIHFL